MLKNHYTVYKHISPSSKVYIGITSQNPPERRWQRGLGYKNQKYFYNAIQKYGWDNFKHEILYSGLSKEEAEKKEIELIARYKSNQRNFGYNIDNGGNCVGKMSEEHKEKIRQTRINKKHTNQSKEKMSISRKKILLIPENNPMYGKHHSINSKNKISIAKKGKSLSLRTRQKISKASKNNHNKSVWQYDLEGKFIRQYKSIKIASEETGIKKDGIIACCKNNYKTSGGFIWRYSTDKITKPYIEWCNSNGHGKAVLQYDKENNFLRRFDNLKNASLQSNTSLCGISACCNGKQFTAGGYKWKYETERM